MGFNISYRDLCRHLMEYELECLGIPCNRSLLDEAYEKMMDDDGIVSLLNPEIMKLILDLKKEKKIEIYETMDDQKEAEAIDGRAAMPEDAEELEL